MVSASSSRPRQLRKNRLKNTSGVVKLHRHSRDRSKAFQDDGCKRPIAAMCSKSVVSSHGETYLSSSSQFPACHPMKPSVGSIKEDRKLTRNSKPTVTKMSKAKQEVGSSRHDQNRAILDWLQKSHHELRKSKRAQERSNRSCELQHVTCSSLEDTVDRNMTGLFRHVDTFSGSGELWASAELDPNFSERTGRLKLSRELEEFDFSDTACMVQTSPSRRMYQRAEVTEYHNLIRVPDLIAKVTLESLTQLPNQEEAIQSQVYDAIGATFSFIHEKDSVYARRQENTVTKITHKQWLRNRFLKARALEQAHWDICRRFNTSEHKNLVQCADGVDGDAELSAKPSNDTCQEYLKHAVLSFGVSHGCVGRPKTTPLQKARRGRLLFKFPAITLVPDQQDSMQPLDDAGDKQQPNVVLTTLLPDQEFRSEKLLADTVVQKSSDWTETNITMITS
ncbi:unnamed protein product [Dicrocoelium dendriticum]|nr:unnamed protein product [Dicrocoelium dendriticum]